MAHLHYHNHQHDHEEPDDSHEHSWQDPNSCLKEDPVAADITDLILGETFPSVGHVIPGPGLSGLPVDQTGTTEVVIYISQYGTDPDEPEFDIQQMIHLPNHSRQYDLYSLMHDLVERAKSRIVQTPGDYHTGPLKQEYL